MNGIDKLAKLSLKLETTVEISAVEQRWSVHICVRLADTYIGKDGALIGRFGYGKTTEEAAKDYLKEIDGERLIIHPSSKSRKEIIFMAGEL